MSRSGAAAGLGMGSCWPRGTTRGAGVNDGGAPGCGGPGCIMRRLGGGKAIRAPIQPEVQHSSTV